MQIPLRQFGHLCGLSDGSAALMRYRLSPPHGNEATYAAMSVICRVLNRLATGFISGARLPLRAPVLKT